MDEQIEAMLRDPGNDETAESARTLAEASKDWPAYANGVRQRGLALAEQGDVDRAVDVLVEAALLFEEELEALPEAANVWQEVLRLRSDHRRALFTLGLILHDLNRWDDLIALYRRRLETSQDSGEQTTLHLYIAELLSERQNDDTAAFDEILKAARLVPSNLRLISRVQHLGERTDRLDEVAVMIGDLLVQQDDPKLRAALSLRLAELNLGPLNDEQRALAYLRAALMDDGENPDILSEIEDVFREQHRFDALASVLEEAVTDRRVGPQRVRLERELARIYEHELGDLPRALAALGRAVRHTPDDRELLDEILRLGTAADRFDTVAELYEHVVEAVDNPLLRTYMRLKLGYIYADNLDRLNDAIRVFTAILDAEPGHEEAQQRLNRLRDKGTAAPAEQHVDPLASVDRSVVYSGRRDDPTEFDGEDFGPETETETVLSMQSRGADVPADRADEPRSYEAESDETESDATTREAEVEGTKADEAEAEGAKADETEAEEAESESAQIEANQIERARVENTQAEAEQAEVEPAARASSPNDTADDNPSEGRASRMDRPSSDASLSAEDDAESVANNAEKEAPRRPVPPLTADDAYINHTSISGPVRPEHQGQLERFEVLQRDLADAVESNDNVRIIHRLVSLIEIFESVGQLERAFVAAIQLVKVAPRPDHLQEVVRLGRAAKAYALLYDTVQTEAMAMGVEQEISFGLLLADVELEDRDDLAAAVARFEALAERFPDNEMLLGRWLTVLDSQDQPEAMSALLVRRSLREDDPRLAFPFVQRAMTLLDERLEAPQRATDLLRAFALREPDYPVAREQLESRMLAEQRYEELAALIEGELDRAEGEARVAKYLQLSELMAESLGQPEQAEELLIRALDERPGSVDLLAGLTRLAEAAARWRDVLSFGQRQLDNATGPAMRLSLRRRLARVAEEKADDPELARELLASAIDEHPNDADLLEQLLRLQMAQHQWSGALETLRLKWEIADSAQLRADVALERAEILFERYDDLPQAIQAVQGALAEVPDHRRAMARMVDLAEAAGHFDDAVRVLEHWATVAEGAEAAEAHAHRGRLLETSFDDPAGAARAYEAALLADVDHTFARRSLLRMAEVQGDYVRALALAVEAAERAEDPRDAALAWQHAGRLAQGGVGDDLEALRCYERALAEDPEDLAT
ncbi:MAG: tetratricopeptide repeat protein, partial [Myxococcota bacterium]